MTLFLILFYLLKIKQKLVAIPTFQKKKSVFHNKNESHH